MPYEDTVGGAEPVLPIAQFAAGALPPSERFGAWRSLVSSVFEARLPEGPVEADFPTTARSIHLGNAFVVSASAASQHFTRSPRLIAAEGLDHYLVQVYRRGVCEGTYGDVQNTVRPGDIKIIDLARPFNTFNTQFENITLTIPRPVLAPLLERPDALHGTVLGRNTALGRVLGGHMRELSANAAELTPTEASTLAAATVRLVAACLGANPRAQDATMPYRLAAISQAVREFIERNLTSPQLQPETLADQLRMSRSQLYRLFADEGGVAAYIQTRRLHRCFGEIANPANNRRQISDVAFSYGFMSEAHFSRAFRRAFGMTPTEARTAAAVSELAAKSSGPERFLTEWMRGLRHP